MEEMLENVNAETVETAAEAVTEAVSTVTKKAKGVTISTPAAITLGAFGLGGAAIVGYNVVKHGITFVKGGLKALRCKKNGAIAEPDEKAKVDGQPVETDIVNTPEGGSSEESTQK